MAKQYIMAIGLKCVVNDKKQEKELPAVKAALHKIRPSLIVSEIDKDKAAELPVIREALLKDILTDIGFFKGRM